MLGAMEPGAQVWKLLLSADAQEEEVAQRGGECHVPGGTQGQAGWGSEQPDGAVGVSVHCTGVRLNGPEGSLPTQYDPMKADFSIFAAISSRFETCFPNV